MNTQTCNMKHRLIFFFSFFIVIQSFAQTDSLLNSLQENNLVQQDLFPRKMLFTQRLVWGEHGLLRFGKTVTPAIRANDMRIRRKMLLAHQVLGLVTMAGFVGQAIVGSQLYADPHNRSTRSMHENLALTVNTTYSLTALMSLFAPPPMVNRDKGITSIRLHKWLAVAHLSGMVATNILASVLEGNPSVRPYHRAAAYTTFFAYAAAIIVLKF